MASNGGRSFLGFPDCLRATATATIMFVCNEIALYCRYAALGSSSRKHHCFEQAIIWKSDPLPLNGSPWWTHDSGPRSSCHNIYSITNTICEAKCCMAEYYEGLIALLQLTISGKFKFLHLKKLSYLMNTRRNL
jgi:hypothetical protein